ncbi:hypothetical protein EON66_01805 [archaeon]|nr:MAG: hypothetical protein EON66_01805 [archaeon]
MCLDIFVRRSATLQSLHISCRRASSADERPTLAHAECDVRHRHMDARIGWLMQELTLLIATAVEQRRLWYVMAGYAAHVDGTGFTASRRVGTIAAPACTQSLFLRRRYNCKWLTVRC